MAGVKGVRSIRAESEGETSYTRYGKVLFLTPLERHCFLLHASSFCHTPKQNSAYLYRAKAPRYRIKD